MEFKKIMTWLDYVTIVFSIITMIGVFWNIFRNKRQFDKIKIVFIIKSNNKEILIDKNLIRRDCKRSEIQGILRNKLIKGKTTYDIEYLKSDKYFENIYRIQTVKSDILKIYLEDDELEPFGLGKEL